MLDFPASPTNGQQFTSGGITWSWDTVKWVVVGAAAVKRPTPLSFALPGKPTSSAKLAVVIPWITTIAANFANSQTYADTAPTANATFNLFQIVAGVATNIGTIILTAGSKTARTFSSSGTTFNPGDALQIVAPATQDTTLSDVSITIYSQPT